jgi:hypothetical protein
METDCNWASAEIETDCFWASTVIEMDCNWALLKLSWTATTRLLLFYGFLQIECLFSLCFKMNCRHHGKTFAFVYLFGVKKVILLIVSSSSFSNLSK